MFKNILCAVEGLPHALNAAKSARELAAATGGALTVSTVTKRFKLTEPVIQYLEIENPGSSEPQRIPDPFTKKVLADARKIATGKGVEAKALTKVGQPADKIVDVASGMGADAIVVGSRGYGDLDGALLVSVSHKVTSLSKCTVMTVK